MAIPVTAAPPLYLAVTHGPLLDYDATTEVELVTPTSQVDSTRDVMVTSLRTDTSDERNQAFLLDVDQPVEDWGGTSIRIGRVLDDDQVTAMEQAVAMVAQRSFPQGTALVQRDHQLDTTTVWFDRPVLVVPSRTPGHHHVYVDARLSAMSCFTVMELMAQAGLGDVRHAQMARERGYATLRVPHGPQNAWARELLHIPQPTVTRCTKTITRDNSPQAPGPLGWFVWLLGTIAVSLVMTSMYYPMHGHVVPPWLVVAVGISTPTTLFATIVWQHRNPVETDDPRQMEQAGPDSTTRRQRAITRIEQTTARYGELRSTPGWLIDHYAMELWSVPETREWNLAMAEVQDAHLDTDPVGDVEDLANRVAGTFGAALQNAERVGSQALGPEFCTKVEAAAETHRRLMDPTTPDNQLAELKTRLDQLLAVCRITLPAPVLVYIERRSRAELPTPPS